MSEVEGNRIVTGDGRAFKAELDLIIRPGTLGRVNHAGREI
ncbi:MAG TPA: hypothetical protein VJ728_09790 [Candidatus Binataceae bacterium]|nr:hypothetical protein [Candidatus Binataceae bacterium]